MSRREIYLADYPSVPYQEALNLQRQILSAKIEGTFPDVLILLEHPPVITIGRRGKRDNILASEETLQTEKVEVVYVERGGDVTYHGPGQIVGYPIFALANYGRDLSRFVFSIEEVLIRVCGDLGIEAGRNSINRGVWVGKKKIASIGLAIRKWISFHGFAYNWAPNMDHFRFITPCGLAGVEMTSVGEILGEPVNPDCLREKICKHFEDVFELRFRTVNLAQELSQSYKKPKVVRTDPRQPATGAQKEEGYEHPQRSQIHKGS